VDNCSGLWITLEPVVLSCGYANDAIAVVKAATENPLLVADGAEEVVIKFVHT
jgi:hypothetical protein